MGKNRKNDSGVQLSLFDDMRSYTDRELVADLTNGKVAEDFVWDYRLETLFNRLTPHRRRIAQVAIELYKRKCVVRNKRKHIRSSNDIYNEMFPLVGDLEVEEFWVLAMNQGCRLMERIRISIGGITQTVTDIRLIVRKLLETGAVVAAVVHNHPSGEVRPSNEDDSLTKAIVSALNLFNIRLIDHVIIGGRDRYYSYSDEGRL